MVLVKNSTTGEWEQVAGNGRAEYGASTVRTGTIITDEIGIGSFALFTITFDTPMPDSDYRITWDWNTAGGNITFAIVTITEKTANGFRLYVRNSDVTANPLTSHVLTWYAFKLYIDTEYNSLLTLPDRVEALETYGKKILWTGTATKGDTIAQFSVQGYDEVIAQVGGTWIRLDSGHGVGANGRKKFTGLYAGRDTAGGAPYEQYYLLDILGTGYIADCAWFNVGSLNIQNARLAGQKAIECITNSVAWSDPVWKNLEDVETNVNVTRIIGVKYPLIV